MYNYFAEHHGKAKKCVMDTWSCLLQEGMQDSCGGGKYRKRPALIFLIIPVAEPSFLACIAIMHQYNVKL